jgi:hypothetical protein
MFKNNQFGPNWHRRCWICVLATAGTALLAGGRVSVTNNSEATWALRLTDGPPSTITVEGQDPPATLRWTRQGEAPVVHLEPGAICTMEFKPMKGLPMSVSLGMVDKTGTEAGQIRVENTPSCIKQFFSRFLGREDGTVSLDHSAAKEADTKAADHWIINSEFWGDPY